MAEDLDRVDTDTAAAERWEGDDSSNDNPVEQEHVALTSRTGNSGLDQET